MIDMHSHILPGVDDGIRSLSETLKIAEEAKNAGFEKVICTTHCSAHFMKNEKKRKRILSTVKKKVEGIDLLLGSEIYIRTDIVDLLKDKTASSLNGTNYVLFEIPLHTDYPELNNVIINLISNGYKPILAHPERYKIIKENPKRIEEILNSGVYLQSNFLSIEGMYGKEAKKTVELLFKHNMVSFLGTDAHRIKDYYPNIEEAKRKIAEIIGEDGVSLLTEENPQKVCNNEKIDFPNWTPIEKKFLGKFE